MIELNMLVGNQVCIKPGSMWDNGYSVYESDYNRNWRVSSVSDFPYIEITCDNTFANIHINYIILVLSSKSNISIQCIPDTNPDDNDTGQQDIPLNQDTSVDNESGNAPEANLTDNVKPNLIKILIWLVSKIKQLIAKLFK